MTQADELELGKELEIDGKKYRIVGAGCADYKFHWNARLLDDKGNLVYKKGSIKTIPIKEAVKW